jgi:hypothetical protein
VQRRDRFQFCPCRHPSPLEIVILSAAKDLLLSLPSPLSLHTDPTRLQRPEGPGFSRAIKTAAPKAQPLCRRRASLRSFAKLCRRSINPDLSDSAIQNMLVQHLPTPSAQEISDPALQCGGITELAFPKDQCPPTEMFQSTKAFPVSFDVPRKFRCPVALPAARHLAFWAPLMLVPKAAVHKDDFLPAAEY